MRAVPAGRHLEPVAIGHDLSASITPVRDALHRLVGERLVEAPRNDGFRVPIITELALRQLYGWQTALLRLAVGVYSGPRTDPIARSDETAHIEPSNPEDPFIALARGSSNAELCAALLKDRQAGPPPGTGREVHSRAGGGARAASGPGRGSPAVGIRAAIAAFSRKGIAPSRTSSRRFRAHPEVHRNNRIIRLL